MKKLISEYKFELGALGVGLLGVLLIVERVELKKTLLASINYFKSLAINITNAVVEKITNFSVSDLLGMLVVFMAILFLVWRIRVRFEKSSHWLADVCPRCGSELHRVHRTSFDRLLSQTLLPDARRYRCANRECAWEGLRRRRLSEHRHHRLETGANQ
jgi:membrane protein required for beta-lactamase induction